MLFGCFPSEGRTISPPVGPAGGRSRSNSIAGRKRGGSVNGLAGRHAGIELIGQDDGTDGLAFAAARALAGHEARPLTDTNPEVAHLAFDLDDLGVVQNLNVRVLTDLGQLRGLDADRAVQRGGVL